MGKSQQNDSNTKIHRFIYFILLLLFIADTGFSFMQHLHQPLDGDMAAHIVPAKNIEPVLQHPLGLEVILHDTIYPNPNRFFCHWAQKSYFRQAPLLLQNFTDPVQSVYLASALFKTILQLLLITILAIAITGSAKIRNLDFIIAVVLITPLFQTNGYRSYMGIIDPSPTYTLFYAMPLLLLLIYFLPYILQSFHGRKPVGGMLRVVPWTLLALFVTLSGPLNPGIVLVSSLLLFTHQAARNLKHNSGKSINRLLDAVLQVPKVTWLWLLPISLLSLYSFYIGTHNSHTIDYQIPLWERYARLPAGLFYVFTQMLGFPVLFVVLTVNALLISRKFKSEKGKKLLRLFGWFGLFSLLYILLLPLGGYKSYRPHILRYDTIMPITVGLAFFFGATSLYLVRRISKTQRYWYLPILAATLILFTNADRMEKDKNKCEREALEQIMTTGNKGLKLENGCKVLTWEEVTHPAANELNAQLLTLWKILPDAKDDPIKPSLQNK